jgi:hypothetical protein
MALSLIEIHFATMLLAPRRLFESHLSNEASASTCGQDRCKEVPTVSRDARKWLRLAK